MDTQTEDVERTGFVSSCDEHNSVQEQTVKPFYTLHFERFPDSSHSGYLDECRPMLSSNATL